MQKLWQTRRREILAGTVCIIALLAALFLRPAPEAPMPESEIGTMRIAEVLAAHPSYAHLRELRAEEQTLTLLLRNLPKLPEIEPPKTDDAPFEDSVWQKNALTIVSARVELEREQKNLTEAIRKATEADYEAKRKAIDDDYLNAILNINLKIDNQRAMHGPNPSEEELARERARWEEEREFLKRERGARQMELYRRWQEEIRARVAAEIGPRQAAWMQQTQETVEAQKAATERLKQEVEERNKAQMKRAVDAREGQSVLTQRAARLAAVRAKADALEAEILRDVRSRAAKLALQYHFSLILASPEESGSPLLSERNPFDVRRYAPLISNTARDVTDEMVREMQSITAAAQK